MNFFGTSLIFGATLLTVFSSAAGVFRFDDQSKNGSYWMDGQNWRNQSDGDVKGQRPGEQDIVRFNFGGKAGVLAADAGSIQKLQIGNDDRGGQLTLNFGANLVVTGQENYIGWMARDEGGTLIVNGGTLTYQGWVSVANQTKGTFILNGGTVRIENAFYHNLRKGGGPAVTRVRNGELDVNKMELNSGVLDFSGGLIRIRSEVSAELIQQWIDQGFLTIKGRTGAVQDVDYAITPWGKQGVEITVMDRPVSLGIVTS